MQSDLISKRALIKFIDKTVVPELLLHDNASGAGVMAGLSKVLEETDVLQTIDAVPVVHGKWELFGADKRGRGGVFKCTACNRCRPTKSDYCPNCGAKMDLKEAPYEENPDPVCTTL